MIGLERSRMVFKIIFQRDSGICAAYVKADSSYLALQVFEAEFESLSKGYEILDMIKEECSYILEAK